jgi:hypothetical protein
MTIPSPEDASGMSEYVALESCSRVAERLRNELSRAGLAVAFEWKSADQLRQLCGVHLTPSLAFGVISPVLALRAAVVNPQTVFASVMPVVLVEREGQTHIFCLQTSEDSGHQIRRLEGAIYATGGRAIASHSLAFNGH